MQAVGELRYRERPPPRRLARIVSCVWVQEVPPEAPTFVRRTVPSGSVELFADLAPGLGATLWVAGPRTGPVV